MADNEGKVSVGLVSGEQNNKDGQQPDLATAVAAAIFEGRTLSDRFALRATIEANAALNQPGAENLILSKSGPNATLAAEEKEKDDREKLSDMAVSYSALAQEQAEWSRTKHEYFGVALTGAEWGELGKQAEAYKAEMAEALSPFEPGKTFANSTDANDFDFANVKHTPHTVYLVVPSGKIGVAAPWLSLIVNHAIEEIAKEVGPLSCRACSSQTP